MRVVVGGGTGFIGSHLVRSLASRGDEVVVLTRDPSRRTAPPGTRLAGWGDPAALSGADAVVNLAGETLAQRWTPRARERIVASRVEALGKLGALLGASKERPKVLVSASAIGYYGARGDEALTEESPAGTDFPARTCVAWEEAARALEPLVGRLALLRFGFVLGTDGGALPRMLPVFHAGLGGPVGSGKQFVSFVHVDDLVRLVLFALDEAPARGALNATAPEPVTMDAFASALRSALKKPAFVPAFLTKLGSSVALPAILGSMSTLVLDGQRVLPERARSLGFSWRYPEVSGALAELLA